MSLVELIKQGDRDAFEEAYRRYFKKVYRFALKHTSNSTQAEDAVHDVFLRLWEKCSLIKPDAPLEAQLFVIARNLMINQYRREFRHQVTNEQLSISEDEDALTDETINELNAAINALPPKRREIFKMSKLEGLTYEEISEVLQISRHTVESQMVKAFKFLRERMAHLPFF